MKREFAPKPPDLRNKGTLSRFFTEVNAEIDFIATLNREAHLYPPHHANN